MFGNLTNENEKMPKKLIASSLVTTSVAATATAAVSASTLKTPLNLQPEHSEVIRRRVKPPNLTQPNHIEQQPSDQHSNLENLDSSKRDLNTNNSSNNSINKRFSCDELEILKERFVDFIRLDQNNQPTATLSAAATVTTTTTPRATESLHHHIQQQQQHQQ